MSKLLSSSSEVNHENSEVPSVQIVNSECQARCILCFKKHQITSCKVCTRCNQISCKSCFKVDKKGVNPSQKKLFNSDNIGKCCFSDLIYQNNLLQDNTIQWGRDSLISANWTSNWYLEDCSLYDENIKLDDSFELSVELSNTKYKNHAEMKLIEKEIFEEDIYAKKNMTRSFAEFQSTIQSEISMDKIKLDQLILLKSFLACMLEQRQTPEDRIYLRGHGMLALFLLCFCSIKRSFFIFKDIFTLYYVDILQPDQFRKESNLSEIVKHIVFIYLENFQKKKDSTPASIEKLVSFSRKYLVNQYNYFFLNQLNFSSAFIILEQLFQQRTYEIMSRTMSSVMHLNLKTILETDLENINLKDIIYNKIQPETLSELLLGKWNTLKNDAISKILEDHYKTCEKQICYQIIYSFIMIKSYDVGAEELNAAVKLCIKKQKNNFRIMEDFYLKELNNLRRALTLAMGELNFSSDKIKKIEVEKNNYIVRLQALNRKYEINEIEYEDIQNKLQYLNERTSKRQMHYNKEYEEQVENLQLQVKNSKLDYKELEMLYKRQSTSSKEQLEEKDNAIKRLKQVIRFLNSSGRESRDRSALQSEINEVLGQQQDINNQQNKLMQEDINPDTNPRLFHSHAQSAHLANSTNQLQRIQENNKFKNQTLFPLRQESEIGSKLSQIQEKQDNLSETNQENSGNKKQAEENLHQNTNDAQEYDQDIDMKMFYSNVPLSSNFNSVVFKQQVSGDGSDNQNEIGKHIMEQYKSFSMNDPQALQQAINAIQFDSGFNQQFAQIPGRLSYSPPRHKSDYPFNQLGLGLHKSQSSSIQFTLKKDVELNPISIDVKTLNYNTNQVPIQFNKEESTLKSLQN